MEADPLEGSSFDINHIVVKIETEDEVDDERGQKLNAVNKKPYSIFMFTDSEVTVDPTTGLLICVLCLEELTNDTLMPHMVEVHKYRNILFRCWICQRTFEERKEMLKHRNSCEPKKYKKRTVRQLILEADALNLKYCPICLIEVEDLREHSNIEHERTLDTVTCDLCNKIFKSTITLGQHMKQVHESKQGSVACGLCGQSFANPKYVQDHVRNVHSFGDKDYICDLCNRSFKSHQLVYQHIKNVHPETMCNKRHKCDICLKDFKSHQSLHRHKKNVHWKKRKSRPEPQKLIKVELQMPKFL